MHELLKERELLQELQASHFLHYFVLKKNALVITFLQDECDHVGVSRHSRNTDCIFGVVFLERFLSSDLVLCQNSESSLLLTRNNILIVDVDAALTTVYNVHTVPDFALLHN